MHFGVLATGSPWADLSAALRKHAGSFEEVFVSTPEEEPGNIAVFDRRGRTQVIDHTFMLSGMAPDLIVVLSEVLPTPVVAYYGESVSGSYCLVVAKAGRLRRLYFACHATIHTPLSVGEPYPFETTESLQSIDGGGAIGALGHYGLLGDGPDQDKPPDKLYAFTPRPGLDAGPLRRLIDDHCARHAHPPDRKPGIAVVGRIIPDGKTDEQ